MKPKFFPGTKCIGIELVGGLGNQLFQLAALEFIAKKEQSCPVVDLSRISSGPFPRHFEVSPDLCKILFHETPIIVSNLNLFNILFKKTIWRIESAFPRLRLPFRFRSNRVGFDPMLFREFKNIVLIGYFQTYYFATLLNWPEKFRGLQIQNSHYSSLLEMMLQLDPTVVHIRGGDFLTDETGIGNLSIQYYKECINKSQSAEDLFWIFSDDVLYATSIAEACNINYSIVDTNRNLSPLETLMLMSNSNKMLISNSTFAWWAAFISNSSNVYAPSKWFKGLEDPRLLYPPNWNQVESIWNN